MSALKLVRYGTSEAEEPLGRIRERFDRQLSDASGVATGKTVQLFGGPLTPLESVRRIVDPVRRHGDKALLEFARKLDGQSLSAGELRVPEDEIRSAKARIAQELLATLEPVGDYLAGPGHVLPTGGTARFFSGLSVNDFLRRTSLVEYSPAALAEEEPHIRRFAEAEGLDAHARSVQIRRSTAP